MERVLGSCAERNLRRLGLSGKGLLLTEMEGNGVLVLQSNPGSPHLSRTSFRVAFGYSGERVGPVPVE